MARRSEWLAETIQIECLETQKLTDSEPRPIRSIYVIRGAFLLHAVLIEAYVVRPSDIFWCSRALAVLPVTKRRSSWTPSPLRQRTVLPFLPGNGRYCNAEAEIRSSHDSCAVIDRAAHPLSPASREIALFDRDRSRGPAET